MAVLTITSQAEFTEKVLNSPQPVLVDFWAPWCGPCKMVGPEVEAVAETCADRAVVAKVNVDEQPQIASQFGISGIPTMLVFKAGKEATRVVGYRPRQDIIAVLDGLK
ncbi:MAG: thioredoxin [Negativicutes bacterium]|nr:thioredoxin [Negativicutes bacterium]